MGAERHNFEPLGSRPDRVPSSSLVDVTEGVSQVLRSRCQAQLALQDLQDRRPDLAIDVLNPDNNASEIRGEAMVDWVAGPGAPAYAAFVEDPTINANDLSPERREDLRDLLEKVLKAKKAH
ncbi:MAG TPA: hypothetical protein VF696_02775 [Candidatus Paceibacterota bacterium]